MVNIGVMAHPSRTEQFGPLVREIYADAIWIDVEGVGESANGDRTWGSLMHREDYWSVVLQDDALPVPNFRDVVHEALEQSPDALVGLYVGTCQPRRAQVETAVELANATDASWLRADALLWGVGVAMPTHLIPRFLSWGNSRQVGHDAKYDTRLGLFAKRIGLPIRYTWPSLVDHADLPSLVKKSRPARVAPCRRVAYRVGVRESWDGPTVQIPPAVRRERRIRPS